MATLSMSSQQAEIVDNISAEEMTERVDLFCWVCGDIANDHGLICTNCRIELDLEDVE